MCGLLTHCGLTAIDGLIRVLRCEIVKMRFLYCGHAGRVRSSQIRVCSVEKGRLPE